MNLNQTRLGSQLAPGWSGINIAILVVLFLLAWPLGLLMLGYILMGESLGLDLSHPETFTSKFERARAAFNAGVEEFNREPGMPGDTTRTTTNAATAEAAPGTANPHSDPDTAAVDESDLRAQRESLETAKRQFEAEKAAFYQRRDNG